MLHAIRDLRRADELLVSGDTLAYLVWTCAEVGKMAEARRCAAEAVSVDPLLWICRWSYAFVTLVDGDFETALARMRDAADVGGGEPIQVFFLAIFSAYAGRMDEACNILGQVASAGASAVSLVSAALRALFRRDTGGLPNSWAVKPSGTLPGWTRSSRGGWPLRAATPARRMRRCTGWQIRSTVDLS